MMPTPSRFAVETIVDIAVDGLVADRTTVAGFMPEPPDDLLRRPAALEPGDDLATQEIVSAHFALPLPAIAGQVLSAQRIVADIFPRAIAPVAPDIMSSSFAPTAPKPARSPTRLPGVPAGTGV